MCLCKAKSAVLINGRLLEIKSWAIDMGCEDPHTVVDALTANAEKEEVSASVVVIKFVADVYLIAERVGLVSVRLGKSN